MSERKDERYFGGLTQAEAAQRRIDKQRFQKELTASNPQERIVHALTERAVKGDPAAVRELRELKVLQPSEDRASDQGLLALLTTEQRACISAALRDEKVPRISRFAPGASNAEVGATLPLHRDSRA